RAVAPDRAPGADHAEDHPGQRPAPAAADRRAGDLEVAGLDAGGAAEQPDPPGAGNPPGAAGGRTGRTPAVDRYLGQGPAGRMAHRPGPGSPVPPGQGRMSTGMSCTRFSPLGNERGASLAVVAVMTVGILAVTAL